MGIRDGVGRLARAGAMGAPTARVVDALERVCPTEGRLAVLMYHRVAEPSERPDLDPALVSATPAVFAEQMAFLAERRPVIGLDRLLSARRGEAELPPGATMVTFDDAYDDFAAHAWPVLRRLGLPVTLFVPTGYPGDGRPFWWDRLYAAITARPRDHLTTPIGDFSLRSEEDRRAAARTLRRSLEGMWHDDALALVNGVASALDAPAPRRAVLSWDELRALAGEGVTLAAHTRTHPRLHLVAPDVVGTELAGSLADLVQELGSAPPAVAYPGGGQSPEVVRAAVEAGIEVGFTTRRGVARLDRCDWLRLPRINVGRRATLPVIRAQLLAPPQRRHAAAGTRALAGRRLR